MRRGLLKFAVVFVCACFLAFGGVFALETHITLYSTGAGACGSLNYYPISVDSNVVHGQDCYGFDHTVDASPMFTITSPSNGEQIAPGREFYFSGTVLNTYNPIPLGGSATFNRTTKSISSSALAPSGYWTFSVGPFTAPINVGDYKLTFSWEQFAGAVNYNKWTGEQLIHVSNVFTAPSCSIVPNIQQPPYDAGQTVRASAQGGDGTFSWAITMGGEGVSPSVSGTGNNLASLVFHTPGKKTWTVTSAGKSASCDVVVSPVNPVQNTLCNPLNQTLFTLYQTNNSHVALFTDIQSDPHASYSVCYNNIFGAEYNQSITPWACSQGNGNRIFNLFEATNSHAQDGKLTSYLVPVCYGDIGCRLTAGNCDYAGGERWVANLSGSNNAHVAIDGTPEPYQLCCNRTGIPLVPPQPHGICGDGVVNNQSTQGVVNLNLVNEQCDYNSPLGNATCSQGFYCNTDCSCITQTTPVIPPVVPTGTQWECNFGGESATLWNYTNNPRTAVPSFTDISTIAERNGGVLQNLCKKSHFTNALSDCCPNGYSCSDQGCIPTNPAPSCLQLGASDCQKDGSLSKTTAYNYATTVSAAEVAHCLSNTQSNSNGCNNTCYCEMDGNACTYKWSPIAPGKSPNDCSPGNPVPGNCMLADVCTHKNLGLGDCINDIQSISILRNVTHNGCLIAPFYIDNRSCEGSTSQSIPCGRALMSLPFFGWSAFWTSMICVSMLYAWFYLRKNNFK